MKKRFVTYLFLFFWVASSEAQGDTTFNQRDVLGRKQGIWKEEINDRGNIYLFAIEHFIDGKLNGMCSYFYPDGKIRVENMRVQGWLEGVTRVYRPNGLLQYETEFLQNREHGLKKYYSYDGHLEEEQEYEMGSKTGVYRRYSKSKRIVAESHMIDGVENGTRRIYADTDQREILREFDFKNDVKIAARYYKKGKVVKQETFGYEESLKKDLEIKAKYGESDW